MVTVLIMGLIYLPLLPYFGLYKGKILLQNDKLMLTMLIRTIQTHTITDYYITHD